VFERYREIQKRRHSFEAKDNGFTLIELLIVIVVLGILAAIVVFSLTGVSGQSKEAACTSDGKSVEIAADAYQAASPTGAYPGDINSLVTTYLHSAPGTGNGYALSIDNAGATVDVSINGGATVAYTAATGCASL
jgi:general secretion pathway protein G